MVGKQVISVLPRSLASSPTAGGSSIVDQWRERVLRLPVSNRLQNAPKRANTNDTLLNHGVVNLTESNRRSTSVAISGWGIMACGTRVRRTKATHDSQRFRVAGYQVRRPPLTKYTVHTNKYIRTLIRFEQSYFVRLKVSTIAYMQTFQKYQTSLSVKISE